MNKKANFNITQWVVAGLLFSAIIAFTVIEINSISVNYEGVETTNILSEDFNDNYNTLSDQLDNIDIMRNTTLSGEGLTFRGAFDVTFGSFFTIVQLVFSTMDIFASSLNTLTFDFPFIDSVALELFLKLIFAIITVVLIITVINALGRNKV